MGLYQSMEKKQAQFKADKKEYEDKFNKMDVELDAKMAFKLKLLEEIEAMNVQEEKANQRAEIEEKKAKKEPLQSEQAIKRVEEANERAEAAFKRAEAIEANAIKAVEIWRDYHEFDALAKDAYVIALEELIKHIRKERPEFDSTILKEALEEQNTELQKLSMEARVWIFPAQKDLEDNAPAP